MPINTPHPSYTNNIDRWKKGRDTYEGEEAVKEANEAYLPKLSSMDSVTDPKYVAYRGRAMFFAATTRTVEGLVGMALRKPIEVELPVRFENYEDDITDTGVSLENFVKQVLGEVLLTARSGIFVDKGLDGSRPYAVIYPAENIINWRIDDKGKPTLIVLLEYEEVQDPDDKYAVAVKEVYRELFLDEETGKYTVREHRQDESNKDKFIITDLGTPTIRGAALEEIPFVFVTPKGTDTTIQKMPLLDMINVNLSHYRTSADLEHGRHFTALPTPYIFGVDAKDDDGAVIEINIGSETAIVSEDPGGSAGYMEFSGQGLSALERAMTEKAEYMAILGATLLQVQKKAAEAAETARINKSGDSSTMISVITSVEAAMQHVLTFMVNWEAIVKEDAVVVDINKDLLDSTIDPQTLTALMAAWQGGGISHETYLHNMKKGEILPDDISVEEELGRIEDEVPENLDGELELTPEEKRKNLRIVKNEDSSFDVTETEASA
jgi:hypothetical protein